MNAHDFATLPQMCATPKTALAPIRRQPTEAVRRIQKAWTLGLRLGTSLILMGLASVSVASDLPVSAGAAPRASVTGLPVAPLVQIDCPNFLKLAGDYQRRFQAPMRSWSVEHLSRHGTRKVLYPFSGPDVITALSLFGTADHLILVADQAVDVNVTARASPQQIEEECRIQSFFARLGYFRTLDLDGRGAIRPRLEKKLVYSILISGSSINRAVALRLNAMGQSEEIEAGSATPHDGLRFQITTADRRLVTVDYLRINLANAALKPDSVQRKFLANHMAATVFVKSASHLLQRGHFSILANMIAQQARVLVQDETGLDIDLIKQHFRVEAHGRFNQPHPIWKDSASGLRLRDLLSTQPAIAQLPFVMGYEKPSGSILLIGTRINPSSK